MDLENVIIVMGLEARGKKANAVHVVGAENVLLAAAQVYIHV
jgi:hypothetical protein